FIAFPGERERESLRVVLGVMAGVLHELGQTLLPAVAAAIEDIAPAGADESPAATGIARRVGVDQTADDMSVRVVQAERGFRERLLLRAVIQHAANFLEGGPQ